MKYIFAIIFFIILSIEFYFYKFINSDILPYVMIISNAMLIVFTVFFEHKVFEEEKKVSIIKIAFVLVCLHSIYTELIKII